MNTKVQNFPITLIMILFTGFFSLQEALSQEPAPLQIEREIRKILPVSEEAIDIFMEKYQKSDFFLISVDEGDTWYHLEQITGINWGILALYNGKHTTELVIGELIKIPAPLFMQRLVYAHEDHVMQLKKRQAIAEEILSNQEHDVVVMTSFFQD